MDDDIPYKPHPAIQKQMQEHAKEFNKYNFYREIDKVQEAASPSEEMRLVLEFLLRFQWLEENAKDLLWYLYGATSEKRLNTYMTSKKRDDIRSLYTRDVIKELGYFHIDEDGYKDELEGLSKELDSLSKVRNRLTHSLYAEEIKEKKLLVEKLKNGLKRSKNLLERVDKLNRIYSRCAAELEIKNRLASRG
ncbi:MAG: hypothetical protein ACREGA_03360 [Candidatus Saccharimonadales bacterium]